MKRLARLFYHLSIPFSYTPEDEEDQHQQRLISTLTLLLALTSVPIVMSVISAQRHLDPTSLPPVARSPLIPGVVAVSLANLALFVVSRTRHWKAAIYITITLQEIALLTTAHLAAHPDRVGGLIAYLIIPTLLCISCLSFEAGAALSLFNVVACLALSLNPALAAHLARALEGVTLVAMTSVLLLADRGRRDRLAQQRAARAKKPARGGNASASRRSCMTRSTQRCMRPIW